MKVYEFFGPPPEPGIERRLADKYRRRARAFDLRVLRAILDQPQTLPTLHEALGDHHAPRILAAVTGLHQDHLILTRLNARQRPSTKSYEATVLGTLVARLIG